MEEESKPDHKRFATCQTCTAIPLVLLEHARQRELSLNRFIRLIGRTKRPADRHWQDSPFSPSDPVIRDWLSNGNNYGIVCGDRLVVVDVDSDEAELAAQQLPKTFTVETPSGHRHRYYVCSHSKPTVLHAPPDQPHPGEVRGDGQFVVGPGSVLMESATTGEWRIVDERSFTVVTVEMLRAAFKEWWTKDRPAPASLPRRALPAQKWLTAEQKQKLTRTLAPFWIHGRRHSLALYTITMLAKRGVAPADAYDVIDTTCQLAKDEERSLRLRMVDEQYRKAALDPARLRGISGLREVLSA
jgi:hypothetical protein